MRRLICSLLCALFASQVALADQFCADVKTVLTSASIEFSDLQGNAIELDDIPPNVQLFSGTQSILGATSCTISKQSSDGGMFSTGYTCGFKNEDIRLAQDSFIGKVGDCLGISMWGEQIAPNGETVAVLGQYGMIRLSFTQQPESIGFGFDVFYDENGKVYGSPLRGNRKMDNNRDRCTPKTPEQIDAFYKMYGARDGATAFENDQFRGYTNQVTSPMVAFVTRPKHPAHPALIVRDLYEQDGSVKMIATGDYAGDCEAFHALLAEVTAMNEGLKRDK